MDINQVVEFTQSAAAAAAAGRLTQLGLRKRFPALLGWLSFVAASNFLYSSLSNTSNAYFWCYIVLLPVESILGVVAVREMFALVFRDYPGIRTSGRWMMYAGVALAVSISLLIARAFQHNSAHGSHHLLLLEVFQRSAILSLAVVILTLVLFLSRYPLNLGRNTYVCSFCFSVFFLSDALRLLIDSLTPTLQNDFVDFSEAMVLTACLGVWALMLTRESAEPKQVLVMPTAHEEHLLQQLDALNSLLSRTARR